MRGCTVTTQPEEVLVRRGLALAWFIVLWDVIEGSSPSPPAWQPTPLP